MKQTKIETAYGTQLLQRIKLEVSVMGLRPRHLPGMPIACRRIWAILPILSLEPAQTAATWLSNLAVDRRRGEPPN
jgi:hypothetical protein